MACRLVGQTGAVTSNFRAAVLEPLTAPRSRLALLGAAVAVVAVGLTIRGVPGPIGDGAGGILYAVLVYLLIAVLTPSASAARIGAVTVIACAAIELLQLTPLPSALAGVLPPVRFVLGTTFVWTDLVTAVVGAIVAVLGDLVLAGVRRRRRGRSIQ